MVRMSAVRPHGQWMANPVTASMCLSRKALRRAVPPVSHCARRTRASARSGSVSRLQLSVRVPDGNHRQRAGHQHADPESEHSEHVDEAE